MCERRGTKRMGKPVSFHYVLNFQAHSQGFLEYPSFLLQVYMHIQKVMGESLVDSLRFCGATLSHIKYPTLRRRHRWVSPMLFQIFPVGWLNWGQGSLRFEITSVRFHLLLHPMKAQRYVPSQDHVESRRGDPYASRASRGGQRLLVTVSGIR